MNTDLRQASRAERSNVAKASVARPIESRVEADIDLCPEADRQLSSGGTARDPEQRLLYARAALAIVPRLLGSIDRNPYRPTYGCLDRQFWHYRTADFPSGMYQEGILPLALVYATPLPGNRWYGQSRLLELAVAGLHYAAKADHADGSCDDYYPFERALGAAVFSLVAAAEAYRLLDLDDSSIVDWLCRRANWVATHQESGQLTNHHALAALGLLNVALLAADDRLRQAADDRLHTVLKWQSPEGWFNEYGGADPGYQTVTIECLAKYRRLSGATWLDEPLASALSFARVFLHPDGSFAGDYGSRGTYHFYPHGTELCAGTNADAADLADGFLQSLANDRRAYFDDDRMFVHYLPTLLCAYRDWSPTRPSPTEPTSNDACRAFPQAQLYVVGDNRQKTVISAARGGIFKRVDQTGTTAGDAGLILETSDGRIAVSQLHGLDRQVNYCAAPEAAHPDADAHADVQQRTKPQIVELAIQGPLHWSQCELMTPVKLTVLRIGMLTFGRWFRGLVRRLLQRRLITGRKPCPVELERVIRLTKSESRPEEWDLQVRDTIRLRDDRTTVRRMHFGTDHQMVYVAAANVYHDSVLRPWTDLGEHVDRLNRERTVTLVRNFDHAGSCQLQCLPTGEHGGSDDRAEVTAGTNLAT